MSEFNPCIVKLGKIEDLPKSDFLSITTVMNEYPVIVKRGQFKEGDLVSFFCYDTILPDTEEFYFLCPTSKDINGNILQLYNVGEVPEKYRVIKAKKMRGTYSEGLVVKAPEGFKEGDSIVEHYSLKKRVYEEELDEVPTANKIKNHNQNEKNPKTFQMFKYDLESFAKYQNKFEENEQVIITEKLEGQNLCMIYAEDKLWVRSRNFFKAKNVKFNPKAYFKRVQNFEHFKSSFIKFYQALFAYIYSYISEPPLAHDHWWKMAQTYNLEKKLKNYKNIAVFGEWYGNLAKWRYDCKGKEQRDFRVFDMYNIKTKKFLEWDDVEKNCQELGLKTVPVLYKGPFHNNDELRALAEGPSTIGTCIREGFVMRSVPESNISGLGRKIVKLKGRDYKLAKG